EQTLGRGLRLPFGAYTGVELLDTLEVLGHERYDELLRKANVLNQQFIDHRTRAILRRNAQGGIEAVAQTTQVSAQLELIDVAQAAGSDSVTGVTGVNGGALGRAVIQSLEDHTARAEEQVKLQVQLPPRSDVPPLHIPKLRMTAVQ